MASLRAIGLLLRRLRSEAGMMALIFVLVAATSFLFSAAPRLFNGVTDNAVRFALNSNTPVQRDIWMDATGLITPGPDGVVSTVQAYGQQREADFPASVERLVSNRYLGITSVRFTVPQSIVSISLRYQEGLTDETRLVAGQWPVDRGMPLRQATIGQDTTNTNTGDQAPSTVFEAALSTTEATEIGAKVGDLLPVTLDTTDPLVPKSAYGIAPTQIQIVGLYEPLDASAEDSLSDTGLLDATLKQAAGGVVAIYTTAYVPAESYPSLAAADLPFRYDWRWQIDPARLDADQVGQLQADLRGLNLTPSSSSQVTNVSLRTGLIAILDQFSGQLASSESVLSIAALGPIGLAAGAIAMLALLLIRRRRGSLLLARGRGASGRLLLWAQFLEAAILTGCAALVGLLLAEAAVPAREAPLSPILALAVAIGGTILLVAATWPAARRPLIRLERDDPPVLRVPPRRLVIEAAIVGFSVVAIFLLRQRGLTIGQVGDAVQFDPLLAVVPLLTGLAAGIVVMRLYPLPVRGLGRLAARRSDFVPVVGLRTVARNPATANLPLLVLMLTAGFAAFSSVMVSSIDGGQLAASYMEVGADYRLESIGTAGLPASIDPTDVPGVSATADGVVDPEAAFVSQTGQHTTMDLDAVDVAAYAAVTSGTAADPDWPVAFTTPASGPGIGTASNPIPVIVSEQFPPSSDDLNPGDTFTVDVGQQSLVLRLVDRRAVIPGLSDVSNFAIVPLGWINAASLTTPLTPTVMWLRASDQAAPALASMTAGVADQVQTISRQDAFNLLHDAPLSEAVSDGFGVALYVAVLYLALTLVGAVIMSASQRTRDLAYLRTLGVSGRQALALTAVEQTPPVLLALIPGVLLGVLVASLVEPGLGLADFVGAPGLPLFVNWANLAFVIVALSLLVVVTVGIGSWLAGRAQLTASLRFEDS